MLCLYGFTGLGKLRFCLLSGVSGLRALYNSRTFCSGVGQAGVEHDFIAGYVRGCRVVPMMVNVIRRVGLFIYSLLSIYAYLGLPILRRFQNFTV